MTAAPKWFTPVALVALLWNLIGCAAYLSDVMLTPEDVAAMSAAQQAMYNARPAWAVAGTAVAVWFGAAGCVALIVRRRWALPLLVLSLLGVVVQDVSFLMVSAAVGADPAAVVLQGLVFVIAIALLWLARTATARGWLA
jgi:lipid-A-disaccharide synthase-like uncharacterized protein